MLLKVLKKLIITLFLRLFFKCKLIVYQMTERVKTALELKENTTKPTNINLVRV